MQRLIQLIAVFGLAGCPSSTGGTDGGDPADEDEGRMEGLDAPDAEDAGADETEADIRADGDPFPPVCGDGYLDPGEECDDANRLNGDGCDWLCRLGDGSFEYPEPDPDVPPVEPEGPAVEVVATEEGLGMVADARWLQLVWGGTNYVLAYAAELPYPVVRVRLVAKNGTAAGGPWDVPVAWGSATLAAVRLGDEVGVLVYESHSGRLLLYRIDSASGPIDAPIELASPAPDGSWPQLLDVAAARGQYLIGCQSWNLTTITDDGARAVDHGTWGPTIDGADFLTQVLATPDGFVATNVRRVAAFDSTLRLIGWSGIIPGDPDSGTDPSVTLYGNDPVVAVADGLLFWWLTLYADATPPLPLDLGDLWVAKTDFAANLVLPPRRVVADVTRSRHGLATATGMAGTAVVYSRCTDDGVSPCTVELVNTDTAGNVRSGPHTLLDAGYGLRSDVPLVVAADDEGFAVVVLNGDWPGDHRVLVFRRFVPSR